MAETATPGPLAAPLPAAATAGVAACLVVMYGPDLGRRTALERATFTIGRSSQSDLCIDQESVSRTHARIVFRDGAHCIEDLGSTNGTHVNDVAVTTPVILTHGMQIKVGSSILKFISGDQLETSYHEEIYRLMTTDALTQTWNRRYLTEALDREINRSARYDRPLSLITFDIDHFKKVNDAWGHVAGDAVLRQLAGAIKAKLRQQDVIARTGGEEFCILLPEVPLESARVIAEKIRAIAERTVTRHDGQDIRCTISVGIGAFDAETATVDLLYKAADARLYEAKNGGRNRCVG
jgi:diguanylate cyclase (GGDEF)-like protein